MVSPRVIAHVDLDAFYASVEIRDDPRLEGRPVVVGGSSDRGVVAAASYEARRFGVHSAMPMVRARRACPGLVVVPPRMAHYAAESRRFFEILGRWSPAVEGLSLDEAFLDLSGTERLFGPPELAIGKLRAEVREELGLACSAGIAPVKFVAKILSDTAKPDGQRRVDSAGLLAFIHPLPVSRLWGVGKRREEELRMTGLRTIGDIARADLDVLVRKLGREAALHLRALAEGRDTREVTPDRDTKSVGSEETFEVDVRDPETLSLHLLAHAEKVAWRLRRLGGRAAGVTLKYKLHDFRLVTRQMRVEPTDDAGALHRASVKLLAEHPPPSPVRLIGLSAFALVLPGAAEPGSAPVALTLDFGDAPVAPECAGSAPKTSRLNAVLDDIRARHGKAAVLRAGLLPFLTRDPTTRPAGRDATDPDD